jgi:hypothetical protein
MTAVAPPADCLEPLRHTVSVPLTPEQAFELFTSGISRWWPLTTHSCSLDREARVSIGTRVGAPVVELGPDGREHAWGVVTQWDPPAAFAMTWHPGRPAAEATRLQVTFASTDAGCDVCVHHDGWEARGGAAPRMRDGYRSGWPMVMAQFVDAAAQR